MIYPYALHTNTYLQCAADNTTSGAIKVPPQTLRPPMVAKETIYGYLHCEASLPPIILVVTSGRNIFYMKRRSRHRLLGLLDTAIQWKDEYDHAKSIDQILTSGCCSGCVCRFVFPIPGLLSLVASTPISNWHDTTTNKISIDLDIANNLRAKQNIINLLLRV